MWSCRRDAEGWCSEQYFHDLPRGTSQSVQEEGVEGKAVEVSIVTSLDDFLFKQ